MFKNHKAQLIRCAILFLSLYALPIAFWLLLAVQDRHWITEEPLFFFVIPVMPFDKYIPHSSFLYGSRLLYLFPSLLVVILSAVPIKSRVLLIGLCMGLVGCSIFGVVEFYDFLDGFYHS